MLSTGKIANEEVCDAVLDLGSDLNDCFSLETTEVNRELFTLRLELETLDVVLELEFTSSLGELGLKSSDVVER